jgi:hypothetical protein
LQQVIAFLSFIRAQLWIYQVLNLCPDPFDHRMRDHR